LGKEIEGFIVRVHQACSSKIQSLFCSSLSRRWIYFGVLWAYRQYQCQFVYLRCAI